MKKLELKHLAPYLPYGLKIQGINHGEIAELSCCTETSVNITARTFQYGMWADIFDIKPILRPLSDLTKVIQHNGNEFIPYIEYNYIREFLEELSTLDHTYMDHVQYKVIEVLFELHFDVFGLIEKGLAIDINTIKK